MCLCLSGSFDFVGRERRLRSVLARSHTSGAEGVSVLETFPHKILFSMECKLGIYALSERTSLFISLIRD